MIVKLIYVKYQNSWWHVVSRPMIAAVIIIIKRELFIVICIRR